jgi:hypothetical protein
MVLARRWKMHDDGGFPIEEGPMTRLSARVLLVAGSSGAIAFAAVFTILTATRAAYDPVRHFVSILSLGDGGWAQIANFVVGGLLIAGLGIGMAQSLTSGPGARWVPRLVTIAGIALVGCGVFIPDPSLGYPPGTPDELVTPLTWHGAIHYLCATVIGIGLSAAVLLALRRGLALGDGALVVISIATVVVAVGGCALVLLFGGPDPVQLVGVLERIGIYAGWAWLAGVGILGLRRA